MEYTTKILIADENSSQRATLKECFMRGGSQRRGRIVEDRPYPSRRRDY